MDYKAQDYRRFGVALGCPDRLYNLADYKGDSEMTGKDDARRPGMDNLLRMSGKYKLVAKYPDGKIVVLEGRNLVTSAGESLAAALFDTNGSENAPDFIAFGSGTEGAIKSDTQLQTEIVAEPRVGTSSTTQTNNILELVWAVTTTAGYTIQEMGVFNASLAGTMIARFLTQTLTVVSGMVIDVTWTITFSGVD